MRAQNAEVQYYFNIIYDSTLVSNSSNMFNRADMQYCIIYGWVESYISLLY